MLGQTASSEGTPGRLGNETSQDDVREAIRKADADLLCETLNRTLVRWIVDVNLGPRDAYPKLWIKAESGDDLMALAQRDKILLGELGFGRRVPETYISETYGIPLAEDGEAVVADGDRESQISDLKSQIAGGKQAFAESRPAGFTPDQQAVEDLVDEVLPAAAAARDRVTADILAACEQAESVEDLQILLAEMIGDRASDEQIAELMTRAMTAANLWGRYAGR